MPSDEGGGRIAVPGNIFCAAFQSEPIEESKNEFS